MADETRNQVIFDWWCDVPAHQMIGSYVNGSGLDLDRCVCGGEAVWLKKDPVASWYTFRVVCDESGWTLARGRIWPAGSDGAIWDEWKEQHVSEM